MVSRPMSERMKASHSERMFRDNPSFRDLPQYSLEELSDAAKALYREILGNSAPFSQVSERLELAYPKFSYVLGQLWGPISEDIRGGNQRNACICRLLSIPLTEFIEVSKLRRGKFIQRALLASDKHRTKASETASKMMSPKRVSKTHLILHEMILSVDPKAIIEWGVNYGGRWKCFDIHSQQINSLIEMHGRVWHDPQRSPASLYSIAVKNAKNDIFKAEIAGSLGKSYVVFWDDEHAGWFDKIRGLYGKDPIGIQEAQDKIGYKFR